MARLSTVDPTTASGKAGELLSAVKSKLGLVPNMTRVMANSPAVLEGYLGFSGALGAGKLPAKLREQLAIIVAETTRCSYCLSAHTAIGKMVGLNPAELAAARRGASGDGKTAAALTFAQTLVLRQGEATDQDVQRVREAGFSDGEIAEIVAHVGLNVFTNYFNKAVGTEIDFPRVEAGELTAV